ncbi:XRE family transcriptional regulator [Gramella sp. BOM4]|nr:XRE family transcriptional regulator [Christiangramia bathymodioli]
MLKIKEVREEKGISQDKMVNLTGIPKRSYVNYENGQTDIPVSKLQNIAIALGVTVSRLLDEKEPTRANEQEGNYQILDSAALNLVRQDVHQVNQNVVSLSEGVTRYMETLTKAVKQGLKNDLKIIQWTEKVDNNRILKVAKDLEKFLEMNKDH